MAAGPESPAQQHTEGPEHGQAAPRLPHFAEPLTVLDILRSIPDSVVTIDGARRIVALNEPARALAGAGDGGATSRHCGSVLRSEICDTDRCPFDRAFFGGETVTTFNVRAQDGTPICINTSPLRNAQGETVGVVETIRVITHINRLIEDLREQRNRVQAVLDSIAEGVLTVDGQGRITSVNPAAQRILACGDEAMGCSAADVLPPEVAGPESPLRETLRTGRPVRNRDVGITDRKGRGIPLSVSTGPFRDETGATLGAVCTLRDLREIERIADERRHRGPFLGIIGTHPRMREVFDLVEMIKDSDSTVLIQGESGTGKGLLAHALHRIGPRRRQPFIKVSCAALPETLLESELFGHERGAFTGAIRDRKGRFELADKGTLFLDEIGDLSPAVQVKLLRVLQEQEFERLGGTETIRVDVRVIAATHRDLPRLMREGKFREDLYYRLNVIPVHLPALRDRRSDVPLLVDHLLDRLAAQGKGKATSISPRAMAILMDHRWPGNVRELENAIEHAVVCSRGSVVEPEALPRALLLPTSPVPGGGLPRERNPARAAEDEREHVLRALESCRWNRGRTAARLGIDRTTLWRKMQRLKIEPPRR
ncbi:MAG: sigma 54-interacting transcriptional regulator [Candidatus Methylomirabilales bacterium]